MPVAQVTISVWAIVWWESAGVILWTVRALTDASPGQGCPPGGRVEPTDDSFEAAVRREVFEETGLIVDVVAGVEPVRVGSFLYFLCRKTGGTMERSSPECDLVTWCPPDQVDVHGPIMHRQRVIEALKAFGLPAPPETRAP